MATIERIAYSGVARRHRAQDPRLIIVHATRGPTTPERQVEATINWFARVNVVERARRRLAGWSPMADFAVGYGRVVQIGDYRTTRSNWSAGYGRHGPGVEWGADEWSIAIEVAQSDRLEPYDAQTIDDLVWLCRRLITEFPSIAPRRIVTWDQRRGEPVPSGLIGHEDTAHGLRTGKSDPGPRFPWDDVLARLTTPSAIRPSLDLAPVLARLDTLDDRLAALGRLGTTRSTKISDINRRLTAISEAAISRDE